MKISSYTTLSELIKSQSAVRLGVDNMPNDEQITNLIKVCTEVFDKVRERFKMPIAITSGFRCEALNKQIGGAKDSQHTEGRAIDIDGDVFGHVSNKDIFEFIKNNLTYDQLIWEFGSDAQPDWVHVSYVEGKNRKNVLRAFRNKKGEVEYQKLIISN